MATGWSMTLPRSSFLSWTTLAFFVVLIPPNVALWVTTLEVERMARTGAKAVLDAAVQVELSRTVTEQLTALERSARQQHELALLGDDDLSYVLRYEGRHAKITDAVDRMLQVESVRPTNRHLAEFQAVESAAFAGLMGHAPGSDAFGRAVDQLDDAAAIARLVADDTSVAVVRASRELEARAEALQRRVVRTAALGLPLVVAMLGLGLLTVVRPIRRLDDAIRAIGAGHLDRPVFVDGPGDARRLGARLEWLRRELLQVEHDREQLLHHVSHQLKTPLTNIREGAQLLGDGVVGPLNAEQDAITRIIATHAGELGHRIDDLLRASELQKHGIRLARAEVAVDELVRSLVCRSEVVARARGVQLVCDLDPVWVWGDPAKLEVAFDNVIANAVKFSPEGGVVSVQLREEDDEVVLRVEDEGPGVDPEERERVFESFVRGRSSWMSHVGGTGLGLAITREYLRAHGGDVWFGDQHPGAQVILAIPKGRG